MSTKSKKKWFKLEDLEKRLGPATIGMFVRSFREADGISQVNFAKRLKISRQNLCDIEMERKLVSPERAAKFAKILGLPEEVLIQIALQDLLRSSELKYRVQIKAAS